MIKVDVLDWNKKKVSTASLPVDIFAGHINKNVIYSVVNWQLAKRRRGCAKAKSRAEVSGGGRKPFRQKGTGNARQGSSRSPLLEGGGVIFGPHQRDYSYTLPKKVKRKGLISALSYLMSEKKLCVISEMKVEKPKTKEVFKKLTSFGKEKALLIDGSLDDSFKRASRNIPNIRYQSVNGLNVYDLLKYDFAILTKDAVSKISQKLKSDKNV